MFIFVYIFVYQIKCVFHFISLRIFSIYLKECLETCSYVYSRDSNICSPWVLQLTKGLQDLQQLPRQDGQAFFLRLLG